MCICHLFRRMPETASIHFQLLFLVLAPEDNSACFLSLQTLSEIFYSLKWKKTPMRISFFRRTIAVATNISSRISTQTDFIGEDSFRGEQTIQCHIFVVVVAQFGTSQQHTCLYSKLHFKCHQQNTLQLNVGHYFVSHLFIANITQATNTTLSAHFKWTINLLLSAFNWRTLFSLDMRFFFSTIHSPNIL